MSTGQLQMGLVQVVARGTGEVIGYAFTVESGAGQLQRWLLYQNPHDSFEIRPPPSTMAGWTLSTWQAEVPRLWKPGSFYVRAQADVYRAGGTYQGRTWTQIPPASQLPQETYPPGTDGPFQLDPSGIRVLLVRQGATVNGLAFSVGGLEDPSSVEYWMLPAGYLPAGGASTADIAMGTQEARSLEEFIDVANRSWGTGCVFVITGCINYRGNVAPAAP